MNMVMGVELRWSDVLRYMYLYLRIHRAFYFPPSLLCVYIYLYLTLPCLF